jgi:2-dehydropantoate 2-reductase
MRYVIYGAGAVGGTIGARLHISGAQVVLIARGPNLLALQRDGLTLQTPDESTQLHIPAVGSPAEANIAPDDIVLLAMKTQDTSAALLELTTALADPATAIVCAQNGVENERLALRHFANVYAMCVWIPAEHLEPGVMKTFAAPTFGVLDLGAAPHGSDERAAQIATALQRAGFASSAYPDIMRWKYAKLLNNLGNAVQVLFGGKWTGSDVQRRARAEAIACYDAAGISYASKAEVTKRHGEMSELRRINGEPYAGGSSWQSLARQTGTIETDYLNGEIVLLGRTHGIPTPVNEALQLTAAQMTRDVAAPESADPAEFDRLVARLA